eukprot:8042-Heterococcus_DN1.PRE.3
MLGRSHCIAHAFDCLQYLMLVLAVDTLTQSIRESPSLKCKTPWVRVLYQDKIIQSLPSKIDGGPHTAASSCTSATALT